MKAGTTILPKIPISNNVYGLYQQLQALGFVPEVKRHVYYQPVRLGVALELANQRQGALAQLDGQLYQQGLETLKQAVVNRGADHVLGSETAIVEVWATKTPSEQKKSRSA